MLCFFNEIEQYDSFELRRALRNHEIDTVVLASDGGSVWEALNMAGIIHDKGIITYVPELPKKMGCYSACSLMFFGGKIRQADGLLAVHQAGTYGSDQDHANEKVSETQQATQFTVSEIIGFLNEFETPPWVYEQMFRSRKFYEFDDDEKERLAARTEEVSSKSLYKINAFINSFLEYLDELADEKKKLEQEKEQTDTSKTSKSKVSEKDVFQTLYYELPFLLTTKLKNSRRYIQIGLGVSTQYDQEILDNVENHQTSLKAELLAALGEYTEEMVQGREDRKVLSNDFRDVINAKLMELEGFGGIKEVHLTSYIMQ